jgi:hypothetical protein
MLVCILILQITLYFIPCSRAETLKALKLCDALTGSLKELKKNDFEDEAWFCHLSEILIAKAEETAESCPKVSRKILLVSSPWRVRAE